MGSILGGVRWLRLAGPLVGLLVLMAGALGCAEEAARPGVPPPQPDPVAHASEAPLGHDDHEDHGHPAIRLSGEALRARFAGGQAAFEVPPDLGRFAQATLSADGDSGALRWRAFSPAEGWSPWRQPEIRFSEGDLHLLRIQPSTPATRLALKGAAGLTDLSVEFLATPSPQRPLWLDRPLEVRPAAEAVEAAPGLPGLAVRRQALVPPPPFVVDRVAWGARQPDLVCNGVRSVYRFTIHHTASPADNGDMPARMRRIQAYHMDGQRWCDIGYHFVVGSDGTVYQGRNDERRPAAHAGGQNDGNIGMSLIGNFDEGPVPAAQFAGAARLLRWALDTHGIAPDRQAVRGHQQWPGNNTACPGAQLFPRLDELLAAALALGPGGEPPAPEDPGPENPVPEDPAPEDPAPEDPAPEDPAPEDPAPEDPAPEDPAPEVPTGGPSDEVGAGRGPGNAAPWTLRWVERPFDLLRQGRSRGRPDLVLGERAEIEWLVRAEGPTAVSDLRVGLTPGPALAVVSARLESDAPAGDRRSWTPVAASLSSADLATLNLPPLQAGASLRLVVMVEAVRLVRSGRLTLQVAAGAGADIGAGGGGERGVLPHDVLAEDAWTFPAGDAADTDGWVRCDDGPALVHGGAGLVVADGRCAAAPAWTEIDTDRWTGLGFELTAARTGSLRVWFAGPGADFDPRHRAVVPLVMGDNTFGLDLQGQAGWSGPVARIAVYADTDIVLARVVAQSTAEAAVGPPVLPWRSPSLDAPDDETPGGGLGAPLDDPGGLGPDERDGPEPGPGPGLPAPEAASQLAEDGGCAQGGGLIPDPVGLPALGTLGLLLLGASRTRRRDRPAARRR